MDDEKQRTSNESTTPTSAPEVPPKPLSYPAIVTTSYQPHQSNQTLVRFLFSLSNLVFFGGSLAGLLVWIYQKYFFPKLKTRTDILVALKLSTLKTYVQLQESLRKLVQSNPKLYQLTALAKRPNQDVQFTPTASLTENQDGLEEELKPRDQTAPSESSSSTDGQTPALKAVQLDTTVTTIPSSSSISHQEENEEEKYGQGVEASSNRTEFNQPIIDYLERIASGLRKRSENLNRVHLTGQDNEQISQSGADSTVSGLGGIECLKRSLKEMGDELASEAQLNTRIHQKLSASSHPHRAFGINYWATALRDSPSAKNVDEEPYFIALMEFKTQIRNLKGLLLNRKKFY
ncbi:hypothetical protein PCANC_22365 [Puccinia coronata f. sp. avenae]|uniref:Peroxin-14 n=1 Tax=Puccinia coronata f. sp. avenae TaxID=200324 RepID=A0A2N5UJ12_9BASI|nr:hypothetical protein PCANC_22365 [Puccinia coronata f. sp. avenae]PLW37754.1 hypothetical protein PCASD_11262 [Puccinia coronata f. sp. avenae]